MKTAKLIRVDSGDYGTLGVLLTGGKAWYTVECPDRDNLTDISRIPPGVYTVSLSFSEKFQKKLYLVEKVNGRSGIRIHAGNWAGDSSKGYRTTLKGCIALGIAGGSPRGQPGVISSEKAIEEMMSYMNGDTFQLTIQNGLKGDT